MVKKSQKMVSVFAVQYYFPPMRECGIQLELEWNDPLSDGNLEAAGQSKFKFTMIQRGDIIKPGWWHWRCRRENGEGEVAYGYVQADSLGHSVVPETFENDSEITARRPGSVGVALCRH